MVQQQLEAPVQAVDSDDDVMVNSDFNNEVFWYCILDGEGRILYLGTDRAKAERHCGPDTTGVGARRMGDAIREAAMNHGARTRGRRPNR